MKLFNKSFSSNSWPGRDNVFQKKIIFMVQPITKNFKQFMAREQAAIGKFVNKYQMIGKRTTVKK
jgi:hypothetical protein